MQLSFLKNINTKTEGIKYIGSKLKIIPYILKGLDNLEGYSILDGFSGSTRVSQAFANNGYKVISNDVAIWSKVFATCYLLSNKSNTNYQELIKYLNNIKPSDGWFTEKYGGYSNEGISVQEDGLKKIWQIHNTRKLDGIREEIKKLNLSEYDESVALTSLIIGLDKVDNTLGHFVSYLKKWSDRSYYNLKLVVPTFCNQEYDHAVIQSDILNSASDIQSDIAYYDPPYGSKNKNMPASRVRYASYYHIWESICLFDNPQTFGKSNRRIDSSDIYNMSQFEDFHKNDSGEYVTDNAINKLLKNTNAKWIILSYSSDGRTDINTLQSILENNGTLLYIQEIDYRKNIMSSMFWTKDWIDDHSLYNKEYIFILEK